MAKCEFCEYANNCAFNKYLVQQNLIRKDGDCRKENKEDCHRYQAITNTIPKEYIEDALKIFGVKDLNGLYEDPAGKMSYEETEIVRKLLDSKES